MYFQVKAIDKEKSNKVYEDVMKKLDRLENDYLPQVKLDKTEVRAIEQAYDYIVRLNHRGFSHVLVKVTMSVYMVKRGLIKS